MVDDKINTSDVYRLYSLFEGKEWFIKHGQKDVFKRFCDLLVNLSDSEKELIFELCERYLWITYNDYYELLKKLLETIGQDKLTKTSRIFVLPIIKPEDKGKVKSSSPLLYLFKSLHFGSEKYAGITFEILEDSDDFGNGKAKINEGDLFFLVDDYLGSGETLDAALTELLKHEFINTDSISILALVAQRECLKILDNKGIAHYATHIRDKGISDHYNSDTLAEKVQVMENIEKFVPDSRFFSFGYRQSEALVTMIRTPDNTFPIFWSDFKTRKENLPAPFKRD